MELCQGGNLTQLIKKRKTIKEAEARIIAAQLLLTVDLLSLRQITHRDLKPQNVLLFSSTDGPSQVLPEDVSVADFGFSCDIAKLKRLPADGEMQYDPRQPITSVGNGVPDAN